MQPVRRSKRLQGLGPNQVPADPGVETSGRSQRPPRSNQKGSGEKADPKHPEHPEHPEHPGTPPKEDAPTGGDAPVDEEDEEAPIGEEALVEALRADRFFKRSVTLTRPKEEKRYKEFKWAIGKGGLGIIFQGKLKKGGKSVAVKVAERFQERAFLRKENSFMATFRDKSRLLHSGEFFLIRSPDLPELSAMTMPLMDTSLQAWKQKHPGSWPPSLMRTISQKCIKCLQQLHVECGIVHRDISPGNFLLKFQSAETKPGSLEDPKSFKVVLADFGTAMYQSTLAEYKERGWNLSFAGSNWFASNRAHKEQVLSYCDDLESLGYTLWAVWGGTVPWQKMEDHKELAKAKEKFLKECEEGKESDEVLKQVQNFMKLVNQLKVEEPVDYEKLCGVFGSIIDDDVVNIPLDYEDIRGIEAVDIQTRDNTEIKWDDIYFNNYEMKYVSGESDPTDFFKDGKATIPGVTKEVAEFLTARGMPAPHLLHAKYFGKGRNDREKMIGFLSETRPEEAAALRGYLRTMVQALYLRFRTI